MTLETKNDNIKITIGVTSIEIVCCDCGKIIELPSHRIETNYGFVWICTECKDKIKCKI